MAGARTFDQRDGGAAGTVIRSLSSRARRWRGVTVDLCARRTPFLVLVVALGWVAMPARSEAAFPGANGNILFQTNRGGDREIYAMSADGDAQVALTDNTSFDGEPAWSPDGLRIAFHSDRGSGGLDQEIYVMNTSGGDQTALTSSASGEFAPSWSPDGRRIAFYSDRDGNWTRSRKPPYI